MEFIQHLQTTYTDPTTSPIRNTGTKPVTVHGGHDILNKDVLVASDRMRLWTELSWHRIT
jgi:hypothetical protein